MKITRTFAALSVAAALALAACGSGGTEKPEATESASASQTESAAPKESGEASPKAGNNAGLQTFLDKYPDAEQIEDDLTDNTEAISALENMPIEPKACGEIRIETEKFFSGNVGSAVGAIALSADVPGVSRGLVVYTMKDDKAAQQVLDNGKSTGKECAQMVIGSGEEQIKSTMSAETMNVDGAQGVFTETTLTLSGVEQTTYSVLLVKGIRVIQVTATGIEASETKQIAIDAAKEL